MGRTFRRRLRKKHSSGIFNIGSDKSIIDFMKWLVSNNWSPTAKHTAAVFPDSGRGLMAQCSIKAGDTIAKLPAELLITVKTVSKSGIGWLFNSDKSFSTQQVIATFVVWEKHLGNDSFWHSYISLLPNTFSSPLFCNKEEIIFFPPFISKRVNLMKVKFDIMYEDLLKTFGHQICRHCNKYFSEIYTRNIFMWAYFIVNSRAVYMSPSYNTDHSIKLYDDNCLALAPYLDLFNHSNTAKVQAYLLENDGTYCLKTLVPYNKYEEVFIHYGSHSNIKLYLEYGFILPQNNNDVVTLEFPDILQAMSDVFQHNAECSNFKYKFLQSHDMLTSLYCNCDGISWNVKVVIFVLMCDSTVDMKTIYRKVFSDGFSLEELQGIREVGKWLVNKKRFEFSQYLCKMKSGITNKGLDGTVLLCVDLLNELSNVLDKSEVAVDNYNLINTS